MNKENTKKLYEDFPDLYKQKDLHMSETCMCWGFECGDGWFDIIYNLSEKLSKIKNVEAFQVKEKFGTLRFYVSSGNEEVYNLINEATEKSSNVCEYCGASPAELTGDGWLKTLCQECSDKK